MRRGLFLLGFVPVVAAAQFVARPGGDTPGAMSGGTFWVSAPVNMTQSLSVDGGVTAKDMHATSLEAKSLYVDGGTTVGPPVTLNGPVSVSGTSTFDGPVSFRQPPTGLAWTATLVRSSTLSLVVGCTSVGSVAVSGAKVGDHCQARRFSGVPAGVRLTCDVNVDGAAEITACALISLQVLPVGTYGVSVIPGQ